MQILYRQSASTLAARSICCSAAHSATEQERMKHTMQKTTKKWFALVLMSALILALALTACTPAATTETDDEGDFTFSLTTLTGETIDDSIISNNKLTMVNYWATWCGPCVGEIPDLQTISENYADKGFSIIGVLVGDEDYDGARTFLSDNEVTYPVVLPEGVFQTLASDIQAIPTTMFFDSNGQQVGDTVVGSKSYDDWAGLIDLLLGQVS